MFLIYVGKTIQIKPPMTGNGWIITYKNGDDWGMDYGIVFTHTSGSINGHYNEWLLQWSIMINNEYNDQ